MVLDEVSTPSSSSKDFSSSYDTPNSDADHYAASSSSVSGDSAILRNLPKPIPILGSLLGYTPSVVQGTIQRSLTHGTEILQRPLTADETTALAYWTAKGLAISSWGNPLGWAGGAYAAYLSRATFRFPFYTPSKEKFKPESMKLGPLEILKGHRARLAWHSLRLAAYGLPGGWIGKILVTTYGATVATVGKHRDSRLEELIDLVIKKTRVARGDMSSTRVGSRANPIRRGEESTSELWKNNRDSTSGDTANDTSPIVGRGFQYEDTGNEGSLLRDSEGLMNDKQRKVQEIKQQASPRRSPIESRASAFELEKVERQPRNFDGDYDDPSPTASSGSTDPGSTGDSVWERIRKEAGSAPSTNRSKWKGKSTMHQEQREGSTTGDSFAFSSSEEDRQLAKDEAQKKFDARVEAERMGGDFSDDRDRRW
ncbi:hypothetical protein MMC06_004528 [Schaereria dolodes]|nr:hypothetical protein [Schaereria dolodes]